MEEHPLDFQEHEALKLILEGTARETGREFFHALVKALADALHTHGAWVTELEPSGEWLKSFALWLGDQWVDDFRYAIQGTPCEEVIHGCRPVHVPENVVDLYPDDPDLKPFGAVSYLGVPLIDPQGKVIGNLAVLDQRPMPEDPRALAIIQIFASRAAAEVSRLLTEQELRAREEQIRGLVDSTLDAIVQLDADLGIVRVNPAAEKTFRAAADRLLGRNFVEFLSGDSGSKFRRYLDALSPSPAGQSSAWISGGLEALRADGSAFPAEASLARFEAGCGSYVTVILRDVDERREAERQIEALRHETEVLKEELRAIEGSGEILGSAPALEAMLGDIEQVAETDATVLVQGETGTGKELVAGAIHDRSPRRGRALVRVNCGAIPGGLIESELFGHEKGAYTGATARRDGRFLLADEGTLFLDEIGELPLDLQVKLLRVVQEGEFEPVGSSRTRKVDVRVIAATNRDLAREIEEGRFREDLYYRLNVFPIHVPPLRDRKEDIPLLAEAFTRRIAAKTGRRIDVISPAELQRLQASDWPGNVRELQNVLERAVITSRDGRLNLDRALPPMPGAAPPVPSASPDRVRTSREMENLERANLLLALERTGWKISGKDGAAALLGLKPSTLNSRIKALGIARPR
ncbi:MAG: sigma-54-dependent Fis family transcriptional regulator [Planctomycetota bacterium]|jgi:PAS domain S-box-containing protein